MALLALLLSQWKVPSRKVSLDSSRVEYTASCLSFFCMILNDDFVHFANLCRAVFLKLFLLEQLLLTKGDIKVVQLI